MSIVSIGLDPAKTVFLVHGVDASGQVGLRRRISRNELVAFFANPSYSSGFGGRCVLG